MTSHKPASHSFIPLQPESHPNKLLKKSIPIAQETRGVHITTTNNRLTLLREIILFILRTKYDTSCGQNAEFVNVTIGDSNKCALKGYLLNIYIISLTEMNVSLQALT